MAEIRIDDRVEIHTGTAGTYWGYVTAITDNTVTLDDVAPDGKPAEAAIGDVKRVVFHGRRPAGHIGRWEGR